MPRDLLEAAKHVGEWCRWSTAVETAAIAAVAVFLKTEPGHITSDCVRMCCAIAVICFALSITLNAFMLGSLPDTRTRRDCLIGGPPSAADR